MMAKWVYVAMWLFVIAIWAVIIWVMAHFIRKWW
jgi:hypothetical protein